VQLFYLLTLLCSWTTESRTTIEPDQQHINEGMHHAPTALPAGHAGVLGRRRRSLPHAPKYMYDLYRRLKAGEEGEEGVEYRSILPTNERDNFSLEFVAGLHQETSSEDDISAITLAELHLRTRHRHTSATDSAVAAAANNITSFGEMSSFYELKPEFHTLVNVGGHEVSLPLHSSKYPGWKRLDVTELVSKEQGQWNLELRFETPEGRVIPLRKILRLSRTPFLLLRSQQAADFEKDFLSTSTGEDSLPKRRRKRFVDAISRHTYHHHHNHPNDIDSHHPNDILSFDLLEQSSDRPRRKLQRRTKDDSVVEMAGNNRHRAMKNRHNKKRYYYDKIGTDKNEKSKKRDKSNVLNLYDDYSDGEVEEEAEGDVLDLDYEQDDLSEAEANQYRFEVNNSGYLPYPKGYSHTNNRKTTSPHRVKKSRRQKKRKHKEDSGGGERLPRIWKTLSHQVDTSLMEDDLEDGAEHECQLQELRVDLRAVGYGKRIISPRRYSANYCKGSCNFPMKKSVSPTNHATVLSILQAANTNKDDHLADEEDDLPAACCVPRKLDSVTLLYFDRDGSVVLKSYPQMAVTSCACR